MNTMPRKLQTDVPGESNLLDAHQQLPRQLGAVALRILTPLARLLIAHGVRFGETERLLKRAFFEAGKQELDRRGLGSNMSRLSVSSGLHRKDVRRLSDEDKHQQDDPVAPAMSVASLLYTRWITDKTLCNQNGPLELPLRSSDDGPSFEQLARQISTDAHPRSLLEELKRLGLVRDSDHGTVSVNPSGFVPLLARSEMLSLLGENISDHLGTAVGNVVDEQAGRLEQAVFVEGLSAKAIGEVEAAARPLWTMVMKAVVDAMKAAGRKHPSPDDSSTYRIRVGMYLYSDLPTDSPQATARSGNSND